jgi:hypothetical protein
MAENPDQIGGGNTEETNGHAAVAMAAATASLTQLSSAAAAAAPSKKKRRAPKPTTTTTASRRRGSEDDEGSDDGVLKAGEIGMYGRAALASQGSSSFEEDFVNVAPSKKRRSVANSKGDEVIEILSSSAGSDFPVDEEVDSDANSDWNSANWEGPPGEEHDGIVYVVVRACRHGPPENGWSHSKHSSSHVKLLAVFRTMDEAKARCDGIKARLDDGGYGDGMIPGGTEWTDEIDVWVQPVPLFNR